MDVSASPLWMLSGPRGAGKTTFCRLVAGYARAAGWDVAGLLSPAVFDREVKTGIQVENLRNGEKRLLAQAAPAPSFDLQLGTWFFDRRAIEWGNRILEASLPCDLFIVDEIGPLELVRGEGWASALPALRQPGYHLGLVVVRPELQAAARAVLPIHETLPLEDSRPIEAQARAWWKQVSGDSYLKSRER